MMNLRTLVAAFVAATLAFAAAPAQATTITTFDFRSEGCGGGGDVCGSFPLVPGDAEYTHSANAAGLAAVSARAESVLPACTPVRCAQNQLRFHAEAVATVWADIETPAGLSAVAVEAAYSVEQIHATESPSIGSAEADASAIVAAVAVPESATTCSDGSSVIGETTQTVTNDLQSMNDVLSTTFRCSGAGSLSAGTWRVSLTLRAEATADGGEADASADGRLHQVSVEQVA